MNKPSYFFVALICFGAMLLLFSGCSRNTEVYSSATTENQDVSRFFPLQSGKAVDYLINNQENQQQFRERFLISTPLSINGQEVFAWLSHDVQYPAYVDTGFLQIKNNALYYYESAIAQPEKLLQPPFEVGRSWTRFDPTNLALGDTGTIIDINEGDGQKDDTSTTPGGSNLSGFGVGKNYPTFGSNYFVISAIEDVYLDDGSLFRNCLRVENQSNGMVNRYWYAPDVGLVKYAIDAASTQYPGGLVIAQVAAPRNN